MISWPNSFVLNGAVINYSLKRRERQQPVALAVKVHVDLEVPWRVVRDCLAGAVLGTVGVCKDPNPEVRQVALERFCLSYEINVGVEKVEAYGLLTRANLLASVQDAFSLQALTSSPQSLWRFRRAANQLAQPWSKSVKGTATMA
ncbi:MULTISPECIES: mechanosensitive ion channel [unclassified Prochlorococcus]|uniref:mechanosensitive ion channel n=1 Tax=unclassified Prochlorococcus TaxID=2627481 RepID=UPI000568BE47|nr:MULTISPECIES: mechanosensitive ion channel [unclassified Prochlorococcus]